MPRFAAAAFALVLLAGATACSDDPEVVSDAGDGGRTEQTTTTADPTDQQETTVPDDPVLAEIEARGKPTVTVPDAPATELQITDDIVGTGAEATADATVTVHYVGVGQQSKQEFDASWGGQPATFPLNRVIEGWSTGLVGMKVGGRRTLVIPGSLAYGPQGYPPDIGPDETLVFTVDMVAVD